MVRVWDVLDQRELSEAWWLDHLDREGTVDRERHREDSASLESDGCLG